MSTDFDSFDASALGEFIQSPLGERNSARIITAVMFIDESSSYGFAGGTAFFLADAAELQSRIAAGSVLGAAVGRVLPLPGGQDIVPPGQISPIPRIEIARPPSFSEVLSVFDAARAGLPELGVVAIMIDSSGSMDRTTIEPAITEFELGLAAAGIGFETFLFAHENWLLWPGQVVDAD